MNHEALSVAPPPDKRCYARSHLSLTCHIGALKDFKGLFQGFTLAEVLVTLGIIGVVSAMTVPSLMQNYQRQSYVT